MLRSRVESIHATVWEIAIRTAKSATRDYAKWSAWNVSSFFGWTCPQVWSGSYATFRAD